MSQTSQPAPSKSPSTGVPSELLEAFRSAGQEHVFQHWQELGASARENLLGQLREVDLGLLRRLGAASSAQPSGRPVDRKPTEVLRLGAEPAETSRAAAVHEGWRLLREGKVGVFLVAGGQGSRLGFDGPKGCLPAGPLSGKTLFQLHAEKISRLKARAGASLPWYVMTSAANDDDTRRYFEEHRYFGLPREDVRFLRQRMLPALDTRGKLILASSSELFLSPNGHGGAYSAFRESGCLEDARSRGIEHLFYFQVDNILIRIADPLFLGLHSLGGSEMSFKVLRKTGPDEKIGVVAVENGKPTVVEYSDLSPEEARLRDAAGDLVYWAGSIAIHAFRLDFFARVAEGGIELPYHAARKSIPALGADGRTAEVDGVKFETFVFDALPFTKRHLHLEVRREEEFGPIKNRTGVDSLETAQALLVEEHRRWLLEAGVPAKGKVEVSPLAAIDPRELADRLDPMPAPIGDADVEVEPDASGRVKLAPAGR
jgi:UDP-N-acetylglucosamine/UDP-N-acetylgalactosamine diphosphorylase